MVDSASIYIEQYMEKVFYFCLKRTGNEADAEDLTSDISLNILTQLEKDVQPMNFPAYVWKIARNRYSAWADQKHKKGETFSRSDVDDFQIPSGQCLENEYVRSEELSLLRRELAFISSEYRDIVVAYYIEDQPIRRIAQKLDLTEGAVKMRLSRIRNILKEGMNMAREFGKRSYNPEEVDFLATGEQSSGLPWSAVKRRIPKNILLQADNNPSTVAELAMELGVAVPYMEEEVALLEKATLLKKLGERYVTNFFIESKACQLENYNILRKYMNEISPLVDAIAKDTLPEIRKLNAARNDMTDMDIKWWLCIYIADILSGPTLHGKNVKPEPRANGETWGFLGLESVELPENAYVGQNGSGSEIGTFWSYKIGDYDMWDRVGGMSCNQTTLLADIVRNRRNLSTLTEQEKQTWENIEGRFAHADANGEVIPDILVFEGDALKRVQESIKNHPQFAKAADFTKKAFEEITAVLNSSVSELLRTQLGFCASMELAKDRILIVHDLVESGALTVPENPDKSTVAMWLFIPD